MTVRVAVRVVVRVWVSVTTKVVLCEIVAADDRGGIEAIEEANDIGITIASMAEEEDEEDVVDAKRGEEGVRDEPVVMEEPGKEDTLAISSKGR